MTPPSLAELDYLGRFSSISVHDNGIVCREHQDTFHRELAEYRPGPEVASLALVAPGEVAKLGDALVPHDDRMIEALLTPRSRERRRS